MPALETIRGVPIARVGTWDTSTGRWVCTREQLDDAVRASKDPAFRKGVLKLGHTDPRFDGQPAVGRLENLRIDASGEVLLADLAGVPAWLAEVLNSAYPSRSVEASLGVVTAAGNAYALVVTGLALLGETAPAIESLADVAQLYEQPTGVEDWIAAARVAASITKDGAVMGTQLGGNQVPPGPTTELGPAVSVVASATIDELITQATQYAATNGLDYPWVREVYTDRVIVGSDSGQAGRLWELGWTEASGEGGGFTFTGPYPVRIEYTRLADAVSAASILSSTLPLRYVRGRGDVTASTPEEQSPVSDLAAQVRERLGLEPTATDEQVTAALDALKGQAAPQGTEQTPAPAGDGATGAAGPASVPATTDNAQAGQQGEGAASSQVSASRRDELERLVAQRVEAAVAPFREQLAATSTELAARKERERVSSRDTLLAAAVTAGKITPADKGKWSELYDKSPDSAAAVEQVFASLAAGTAIPTAPVAGAHTGGAEPTGDGITDAEYASLFPDEKASA